MKVSLTLLLDGKSYSGEAELTASVPARVPEYRPKRLGITQALREYIKGIYPHPVDEGIAI